MRFRIFLFTVANLIAALAVVWFLDYFSIWKGWTKGSEWVARLRSGKSATSETRPGDLALLERAEQDKVIESFELREADLKKYEESLKAREDGLVKSEASVKQDRAAVEEMKKKFAAKNADLKAYDKKVADLAGRFGNMPPDKAVERILALGDDLLILDTLKAMDAASAAKGQASTVPYLYSLMPPADASRLLRLSTAGD